MRRLVSVGGCAAGLARRRGFASCHAYQSIHDGFEFTDRGDAGFMDILNDAKQHQFVEWLFYSYPVPLYHEPVLSK